MSAALSEKTGGASGRARQSDLQLLPSGHFSVQKHRTRDRHDLDGQKPGRCASIGGFRDRFKTRLIPAFFLSTLLNVSITWTREEQLVYVQHCSEVQGAHRGVFGMLGATLTMQLQVATML